MKPTITHNGKTTCKHDTLCCPACKRELCMETDNVTKLVTLYCGSGRCTSVVANQGVTALDDFDAHKDLTEAVWREVEREPVEAMSDMDVRDFLRSVALAAKGELR